MKLLFNIILIASFSGFLFWSCKDTITNDDIDKVIIPSTNVSYEKYIQPIFNLKCTSSGCHNDKDRAKNLVLTLWELATSDPSIVFPNKPENSKLYWAITGASGTLPMPPIGFPPLTQNQIEGIRIWIAEGAKKN